jgi:UDP-glucose 4-epimerase
VYDNLSNSKYDSQTLPLSFYISMIHECTRTLSTQHSSHILLRDRSTESLTRVGQLTGKASMIHFVEGDICDAAGMEAVFKAHTFDAVIHFAGLKALGESVQKPLLYYDNNITGTLVLLKLMGQHGCRRLVFSSSATVYGEPSGDPSAITEDFLLRTTNPYAALKLSNSQTLKLTMCTRSLETHASVHTLLLLTRSPVHTAGTAAPSCSWRTSCATCAWPNPVSGR